jgi:hypothetical protein
MANRAHQQVAHSTMFKALHNNELPPLRVVMAIVEGCGGHDDDQASFATAWRRIASRLGASEGAGTPALRGVGDHEQPGSGPTG